MVIGKFYASTLFSYTPFIIYLIGSIKTPLLTTTPSHVNMNKTPVKTNIETIEPHLELNPTHK